MYEAATATAICSENSHSNEKLTCFHPCHSLLGRQGRSPFLLFFCLQPTGRPLSSTSRYVMRQPASIFVFPFGPAISLQTAFFLEVIWITSIPCREAGSYKKLYPRESELLSPAAVWRLLSLIHQPIQMLWIHSRTLGYNLIFPSLLKFGRPPQHNSKKLCMR